MQKTPPRYAVSLHAPELARTPDSSSAWARCTHVLLLDVTPRDCNAQQCSWGEELASPWSLFRYRYYALCLLPTISNFCKKRKFSLLQTATDTTLRRRD